MAEEEENNTDPKDPLGILKKRTAVSHNDPLGLLIKKKDDFQELGTYIKPAPSSSNADVGTYTLAQGKATIDSIQSGTVQQDQPSVAQQQNNQQANDLVASVGNGTPAPSKEATDNLIKKVTDPEYEDPNDKGTYSPYAIAGAFNEKLADLTDAGQGVLKTIKSLIPNEQYRGTEGELANATSDYGIGLLNWASNYLKEGAKENPLPNTLPGQIVKGTVGTIPTLLGAYVTGGASAEGEFTADATTLGGKYLTGTDVVQNALTKASGPLTQYLTVAGAGKGLNEGYDQSGGQLLSTLLGGIKGAQEGAESGIALETQMGTADQLGGKLFNLALKSGVVNEDGLLTQQALKSIVAAPTVFAASSVADDLFNGRPINWQNAGVSAATALPFEAQHVVEAAGNQEALNDTKAKLNTSIQTAIDATNNNAIVNFATATPEDIVTTMQKPETAQELQIQALAKGVEAQNATTYQDKNTMHLQQLDLQKQADIKGIGDTVMQHGETAFGDAVNQTELPDDMKNNLLLKAKAVNNEFNPLIQERQETEAAIDNLTDKINTIQAQPDGANPITNPEGTAELIKTVEQRTDLQVEQLDKTIGNPEHLLSKVKEDEQGIIQETNEAPPEDAGTASTELGKAITDGNATSSETTELGREPGVEPTGTPFQFRSKEHGPIDIQPLSNGEFHVKFNDGTEIDLDKETVKEVTGFDTNKINAPEFEQKLHSTDNEHEIARMYDDKVKELQEPSNSKDHAIANYGPTTTRENFANVDDENHLKGAPTIALNYFRKDGVNGLDTQADEINRQYFNGKDEVKPEDITDFMKRYANGTRTFFSPAGNAELKAIGERYAEITTKDINSKTANKLSKEMPLVTKGEIHSAQAEIEGVHNTSTIRRFIEEQLGKPGPHDEEMIIKEIEAQFERYLADPNNEFNIFHDILRGEGIDPETEKIIRDEINEAKSDRYSNREVGEEPTVEDKSEIAEPQEGEGSATEPATVDEDEVQFQRSAGESMPPERAKAAQDLLEKVFPNVETIFHPTVEAFAEAAKANDIDAKDLPNAFVDKTGKINFNPERLNKDTQIHEYGHILIQWAKENAPGLYKRMIAFGADAKNIHEELLGNGYKLTNTRLAEEAFVTMLGREGEGKLDQVIKNSGTRGTVSKFINDAWTKFQRYVLEKTGFDISKFKNVKNMPINEFLDTINSKYLLSDTKIGDIGTRELNEVSEQRTKPVKTPGETMAQYAQRVIDWTEEQRGGQKAIEFNKPEEEKEESKSEQEERGYDPEMIEANNAYMDAKVQGKFGIEALDHIMAQMQDTDLKAIVEKVKSKMKGDNKYLEDTRNRVIKNQSGTATDQAALLMDQYSLKAQEESLIKEINNETDPEEKKILQKKLFDNQSAILDNALANRLAGRDSSTLFRLRQVAINQEADLDYMREKYMASEGTKELTPEQEEFVRDQYKKIRDAEIEVKNIKDQESQTRAENEKLKAENEALRKIIDTTKAKYHERTQATADRLGKIRKDIDNSKQRLKELVFGHTNSLGILHPEIYKELKNIGFKKAEEIYLRTKGTIDLDGYVKHVMDEIKDVAPNITERDVRDALTDNYQKGKPRIKSELQKNIEELKRQAKILNDYQDIISGENDDKKINTDDKAEVDQLKTERENSDIDGKEWNVKRYKEIKQQINDYQQKLDKGEFTTPSKEAAKYEKSQALKDAEHELAVKKFLWDKKMKEGLLKQRSPFKKVIDNILAWQRFAVLSYPSTIVKLISTVAHGLLIKPIQLAHQELSYQILHQIGKMTGRSGASGDINGKVRVESIIKYYSAFVRNFAIENLTNAFKGIDKADIMYGQSKHMDNEDMGSGYYDTIIAGPGRSHGYIKSFLKAPETAFAHEQLMQAAYEKSNAIQTQLANENLSADDRANLEKEYSKHDLTDQENIERINELSAAQGNWGILMNRNKFVEGFRGWMERNGLLGDFIKSELPVLKIPVNYVNRYFLLKLGWVKALIGKPDAPGLIRIAIKGTDGMTDVQKEILSRTIAYGSMGATIAVAGFLLRKNIKQNTDGSAEIDGVHVPKVLLHAPATDIFLGGVNMGNHIDKLKGKEGANDYIRAYVESDIDVIRKMPFTSQLEYGFFVKVAQAVYLKSEESREKKVYSAFDKKIADQFTPGFIKEWAQIQDENSKGEVIKRVPNNLIENIETGIPGLRENVPKK